MTGRITKRSVDALKAGASSRFLWDRRLPGFGARITPNGVLSYVFQYEIAGRSRRLTIGRHGSPWTPAAARVEAIRLRAEVTIGRDPAELKKELRRAETMEAFAERYLVEHAEPKKKPRSVAEDRRLLEKIILPKLGRRKIKDLSRADLARVHHELRQTPYVANRVVALLSKMFNLAERWGLRTDGSNPCRHIERFREKHRERFLSSAELKRLGEVLADSNRGGSEPWEAIAAIRLLLFTGCRLGEILGLEWNHVDRKGRRLVLPDSKTGAKVVQLSAPAARVLEDLPRIEGSPYVLPARRGVGHFVGVPHVWRRVREKAALEDVRVHDLRHTFASVGAARGESLVLIGALLGHHQPTTTARYAHLANGPVREAGDRIAEIIRFDLEGAGRGEAISIGRETRRVSNKQRNATVQGGDLGPG